MNESVEKKSRIYIFSLSGFNSNKKSKKIRLLRNELKENYIEGVILIDLKNFLMNLIGLYGKKIRVEELNFLETNYNLPIIFYGLDEDYYDFTLFILGWEDCENVGWINNPHEINLLKRLINEMSGG